MSSLPALGRRGQKQAASTCPQSVVCPVLARFPNVCEGIYKTVACLPATSLQYHQLSPTVAVIPLLKHRKLFQHPAE